MHMDHSIQIGVVARTRRSIRVRPDVQVVDLEMSPSVGSARVHV